MIEIHKNWNGAEILVVDSGDGESKCFFISEKDYDPLVLDLEAKARELWPHKFQPRTLNDWHKEFVNVEQDDGETDMLTAEEARRLDLRIRQQQIPINSKKHGL